MPYHTYLTPYGKKTYCHIDLVPSWISLENKKIYRAVNNNNERQRMVHYGQRQLLANTVPYDAIHSRNSPAVRWFLYAMLIDEILPLYFKNLNDQDLERIGHPDHLFAVAPLQMKKGVRIYGFCPFHRREHQRNPYYLKYRDNGRTIFGCFDSEDTIIFKNFVSVPHPGISGEMYWAPLLDALKKENGQTAYDLE